MVRKTKRVLARKRQYTNPEWRAILLGDEWPWAWTFLGLIGEVPQTTNDEARVLREAWEFWKEALQAERPELTSPLERWSPKRFG